MFPLISHINDLIPHISTKPEIRVAEHDGQMSGYKTACYMLSGANTFDNDFARECRGITFFPDGSIASRSMHKFFNVGERADTLEHVLDFSKVQCIMDKRDGSMIHPVPTVDRKDYVMKSKKSFASDVAVAADRFAHFSTDIDTFIKRCIIDGLTPTFEYTSPKHRIVLNYKTEELQVLHIRENVSGRYFTRAQIDEYVNNIQLQGSIKIVEVIDSTFDSLKSNLNDFDDIEGFIIQFESGEMVKLKTPWYLSLHHNVTFQTERGVARMVLDETVDDFKSYLTMVGATDTFEKVVKIERNVLLTIKRIEGTVEKFCEIYSRMHGHNRKEFAIAVKSDLNVEQLNLFGLIMTLYSGKVPDYRAFYEKHYLESRFSSDQI